MMASPHLDVCRACGAPIYWLRPLGDEGQAAEPIDATPDLDGNVGAYPYLGRFEILEPGEMAVLRANHLALHRHHHESCTAGIAGPIVGYAKTDADANASANAM